MKVLIIVFSPAGSTLKIAGLLEEKLIAAKNQVEILNVTSNKAMFKDGKIKETLAEKVNDHDLICIGSPVYEKHMEFYFKQIVKQLPKPDNKWGKLAIPFVTYGGISSGNALLEAERLLKKSGRTTIAAMKIEASHIISSKLITRVNEGMPGEEAIPFIDELVKRISEVEKENNQVKDFSKELNYHSFREKMICKLMKEKMLHKHKYPAFVVNNDKCNKCNKCYKCTEKCPVQRIEIINEFPKMAGKDHVCIHCFSCTGVCPSGAITFKNDEKDWGEINRILKLVSAENSFFKSMEMPRSAVYPLREK